MVLKLRGLAISTGVIGLLGLGGWVALSNIYGIQLQQEVQVSSFAAAIDEIRRQQVRDVESSPLLVCILASIKSNDEVSCRLAVQHRLGIEARGSPMPM